MSLVLLEYATNAALRSELTPLFDGIAGAARKAGGDVLEVQIGADLRRAYVIVADADQAALTVALRESGVPPDDSAEVRLVGATVEDVRSARGQANYLVEWDLPAELTMETYLARKKAKAPLYANVPEVRFLRTYVREDMGKCLCFYQAPDEAAVCRAREAVTTPIDRLTALDVPVHAQP